MQKKQEKIIALLVLVSFFFTLMPISVFAETEVVTETSGKCGENATWEFDAETGTLTISGTGNMASYLSFESDGWTEDLRPWKDFCDKIKVVIVDEGVTELGEYSLVNCCNIKKIIVASTVTGLENFLGGIGTRFDNLKTVGPIDGGYDVEFAWKDDIPEGAFANCSSIESIVIPEGVTEIKRITFHQCDDLKRIKLPESLEVIGTHAFSYCDDLIEVNIPKNVKSIDGAAFDGCGSLETVVLPENLEYLGPAVFRFCSSLKSVNLPDSITIIDELFRECYSLENISIPNGVKEITKSSFEGCSSLKEIIIPESVEKIGSSAFSYCSKLESIKLLGENTLVTGDAFEGTLLKTAGPVGENDYDYQFSWKKEIPDGAFIGAFGISLESVIIPKGIEIIGEGAFKYSYSITELMLPNSLKEIKEDAFNTCGLTAIIIPENVETIGDYAFSNCNELNTITFEGSAPYIGYRCFYGVTATAYYTPDETWTEEVMDNYGGNITWVSTVTEPEVNNNPVSPEKSYVEIPSEVYTTSDITMKLKLYDEDGNPTTVLGNMYCWGEKDGKIYDIGGGSYVSGNDGELYYDGLSCFGIENASSDTVIATRLPIGEYKICYAFTKPEYKDGILIAPENTKYHNLSVIVNYNCGENAIWSLDDNGVLTISGSGAIEDCTWRPYNSEIKTVVIGNDITDIPAHAFYSGLFYGAENLSAIVVSEDNTRYYSVDGVLYQYGEDGDILICYPNDKMDTSFTVPESVTEIYGHAFFENSNLEKLILNEKVTVLETGCFENCANLKKIYIPKSVNLFGEHLFNFSNSLEDVYYGGNEAEWIALLGEEGICEDAVIHFNANGIPSDSDSNTSNGSTSSSGGGSYYVPSVSTATDEISVSNTNSDVIVETSAVKTSVISSAENVASADSSIDIIGGAECAVSISAEDKQGNTLGRVLYACYG